MKERSRRSRLWLWVALGVALAGGLWLWLWDTHRVPQVQVTTVLRTDMQNKIFAAGAVKPVARQIVNTTDLPAPVDSVDTAIGQSVKRGQVLLRCQNATQTAALKGALQARDIARTAWQQAQHIYNSAPVGLQPQLSAQLDTAHNAYLQAQTQLAQAQAAYDATLVRAQMDGIVIALNPNGLAADGSPAPVIEVVGDAKQIVVDVSEVDAVRVHVGLPASVTADAFPGKQWSADVSGVGLFAADSSSGTGQVEIHLTVPGDFAVPWGYHVDVRIISETRRAVPVVPYNALVQQGSGYATFTYAAGHVHLHPVTLGITGDASVEVVKGLKPGEQVVQNPPGNLKDGQAVRVS